MRIRFITPLAVPLTLALAVACNGDGKDDTGGGGTGGDVTDDTGEDPIDDTGEDVVDEDGDGYSPGEDCDDTDAEINPDATEVCDGVDNDCDGTIDGPDAEDAVSWYVDADGDGFGGDATLASGCEAPDDSVDAGGDCDDADADVNPDAVEICGDGVDNDCDSASETCEAVVTSVGQGLAGVADDDNAGSAIIAGRDINHDGAVDLVVAAKEVDAGPGDEGAAYVVFGPLSAGTSSLASGVRIVGTETGEGVGTAMAVPGDIDGDGIDDLVVTALESDQDRVNNGKAFVFLGSTTDDWTSATGDVSVGAADYTLYGEANYAWVGAGVTGGDLTGDGIDDLVLGSSGDREVANGGGAVWLIAGETSGFSGGASEGVSSASYAKITGAAERDYVGANLAVPGDLDGDGLDDLLIGVNLTDPTGDESGGAYIAKGPISGTQTILDLDVVMPGPSAGVRFGNSVAPAGDADGDGNPDFWIGSNRADSTGNQAGALYLFLGGSDIVTRLDEQDPETVAASAIFGAAAGHGLGSSIAGGVDHDGDGEVDIIVGAGGAGDNGNGAAYLLYGPFNGTADAESTARARVYGEQSGDGLGVAVGFGGDLFGTGAETLVVGSAQYDGAASGAGSVWVIGEIAE